MQTGSGRQSPQPPRRLVARLGVFVSGLIAAGVIDPPLDLERRYLDRKLTAQIEPDGSVTCEGRNFATLSSAASYARTTCSRKRDDDTSKLPSNGWSFWQFRNPAGELETMRDLRRRFLKG
jgi:hypothetical protein